MRSYQIHVVRLLAFISAVGVAACASTRAPPAWQTPPARPPQTSVRSAPSVAAAVAPPPSLEFIPIWDARHPPRAKTAISLYGLDCIHDRALNVGRMRCGARGSLSLPERRFPHLELSRLRHCHVVTERPATAALVAWGERGFSGVSPLTPDSIVVVRKLVRERAEHMSASGCENPDPQACDPISRFSLGKLLAERTETHIVAPSLEPADVRWLPDDSALIPRTIVHLWLTPMVENAEHRWVADQRFRLDRGTESNLEAQARSVRSRLESIDPASESQHVQLALAVNLTLIAIALDDRQALERLHRRLESVSEELEPHSSPTAFGRYQSSKTLELAARVLDGSASARDPCDSGDGA